MLPGVGRDSRELEQVVERKAHALHVAHDDAHEPLLLGVRELGHLQQLARTHRCANAVAQLVRERAVEGAQPLLALAQPLLHEREELHGGRLLDERDRVVETVRAEDELRSRAGLVDLVHRL